MYGRERDEKIGKEERRKRERRRKRNIVFANVSEIFN